MAGFSAGFSPLAALAPYAYDASGCLEDGVVVSRAGDLAHGVVEGQAEHAHEEVNCYELFSDRVFGQIAVVGFAPNSRAAIRFWSPIAPLTA